jgi:hypothetical protein
MTGFPHQFAGALGQAWLRLWVDINPDSPLKQYLRDTSCFASALPVLPTLPTLPALPVLPVLPAAATAPPRLPPRSSRPPGQAATTRKRRVTGNGATQKPRPAAKPRITEHQALHNVGLSDWATQLLGDARNQDHTLDDVIDGIENYFDIVGQMKKFDKHAYKYFSRIGAPLGLRHIAIWKSDFDRMKINNADSLPAFFGTFFPSTRDEFRKNVKDDSHMFEFMYFHKMKTHATVAPLGSTVFVHNTISLKQGYLTKEELKQFPWARENWGFGWFVGVLPDGTVRALPSQMNRAQRLPGGDVIHHSNFEIPRGLSELSGRTRDPHELTRMMFALVLATTSSALLGLQVTIKKGARNVRFGIPISYAKTFFADRDTNGARRNPILHLIFPHDRHMNDGRIIRVGEHLRGERQFEWRGYQVTIGAPGIHFPAPEAFVDSSWDLETLSADELPRDEGDMMTIGQVGNTMERWMWKPRKPRFQKGVPKSQWPRPDYSEVSKKKD